MWSLRPAAALVLAILVAGSIGCGAAEPQLGDGSPPAATVDLTPSMQPRPSAAPQATADTPPGRAYRLEPISRLTAWTSSPDDRHYVTHLAYVPRSNHLVLGNADGEMVMVDAMTGSELRRFPKLPGFLSSLELSRDGRQLLTVSRGEARVWEIATGTEQQRLEVGVLSALHFVPDGTHFAECDSTRLVRFLKRTTGTESRSFGKSDRSGELRQNLLTPTSISFSPDGRRMALARWDQELTVWDVDSGAKVATLPGRLTVRWSPDGRLLAAAVGTISKRVDRTALRLRLFEAASGREIATLQEPHPSSARFSPDSSLIAAVGDGELRIWSTVSGTKAGRGRHAQHVPTAVSFAPDGHHLATGGRDGDAVVWRLRRRNP